MTDSATQPPSGQATSSTAGPAAALAAAQKSSGKTACPPHVLEAIYGKQINKKEALEKSLQRWWTEYADRKNDDNTDEYVADSLLYDRRHLPRTAPPPDCVRRQTQQPAAPAAAAAVGAAVQQQTADPPAPLEAQAAAS